MKLTIPYDEYSVSLLAHTSDHFAGLVDRFLRNFRAASVQANTPPIDYPGISPNVQAVVNGIMGDTLAAVGHPLAISMAFRVKGVPLTLTRRALVSAFPYATSKLIVLVHGLCMNDLQWPEIIASDCHDDSEFDYLLREEEEYSFILQGYTCVYLHYNTGHHISTNGQEFGSLLEKLISQWPLPINELVIIGNSLGGLVSRSACHYSLLAGHQWLALLSKLVFVGVPHHGSHWERLGNWFDLKLSSNRYTAQLATLAKIRSAGITDLRFGCLLDNDWLGHDRFDPQGDAPQPVSLPEGVDCYSIAATLGKCKGNLRSRIIGDGIVPLNSALGRHPDPGRCLAFSQLNQSIFYNTHHLELLRHPTAFTQIKNWLCSPATDYLKP